MNDQATATDQRNWADGLLLWTLGAWFVATAGMSYIAGANFGHLKPDTLLRSAEVFAPLAEGEERTQALRYIASELNRAYFSTYGVAQLAMCVLAGVGVFFGARSGRAIQAVVGLCVVGALVMTFYVTPTIIDVGRTIDFMPRDPKPPEVVRFDGLHHMAVGIETVKLLLLLVGAFLCARRPKA